MSRIVVVVALLCAPSLACVKGLARARRRTLSLFAKVR